MKIKISIILQILFYSGIFCQEDGRHIYRDENIQCEYYLKNHLLDGNYNSFYSNGKKKAEGKFCANQRCGDWTLYDSSGTLKSKRFYYNSFSFKQSFSNEMKLGMTEKKKNYYEYLPLKEPDIIWEHRVWRNIFAGSNPLLFQQALKDSLLIKMLSGSINVFDEDFLALTPPDSIKKLIATTSELIGFKIKEDAFVHLQRMTQESRIIGICPIFKNNIDTIMAGWLYFPAARGIFANIPAVVPHQPLIQNLDDLLHLRYFTSSLYKENNVYSREISELYKSEFERQRARERTEVYLIESAHLDKNWNR